MRKLIFTIFAFFMMAYVAYGQKTISGTVLDTDDNPIIGANVLVQGTSSGTITDLDGSFRLEVPDGRTKLEISFTGYVSQIIDITTESTVEVVLVQGQFLDEIVISGQGSGIQKKRLSTTVDFLNSEDLDKIPAGQIDQILQSTSPSAQIRLSSGQPGTASIVRTRGPISASSSSTPVIIVDGIRVDNLNSNPALGLGTGGANTSALADIPAETIEKIEYIKGGAATTLYGADAANGVIQIITKKGHKGDGNVYVETNVGVIKATTDFLKYDRTAEAIFETGISQELRVGFNGGSDRFTYNFAGSVYGDDSFNDLNEQRKRALSFGFKADINDWIEYQGSISYVNFNSNLDFNANTSYSRYSAFEGGGRGNLDELSDEEWAAELKRSQDLARLVDITGSSDRFTVSNKFNFNIAPSLKSSFTVGVDSRLAKQEQNNTNELLITLGAIAPGSTDQAEFFRTLRNSTTISADLNFTHDAALNKFSFVTVFGGNFFRTNDEQNRLDGTGGVDGSRSINTFPSQTTQDFVLQNANYGLYFYENVGFNDVVYLEIGGRYDNNTSAGSNTSGLFLPKVGIVYNISDHEFYRNSNISNTISGIKLRANYGEATNFAQPFSQDRTFALENFLDQPAFRFDNPGNPLLVSEKVKTTEFGAEFGFFDYRLTTSITRYKAITEDALFTPTQPPSSGLLDQVQNIGEIENTGWEFALSANIVNTTDHSLDLSVSYNTNDNVVTSTGGAAPFVVGGFQVIGSWVEEGQSLGYLRGTVATVDENGDFSFTPNSAMGKTFAPQFGSIGLNYSWRNFNLFASADYQMGGTIVDLSFLLRHLRGVDNTGIPEELIGATSPFNYVNYFTFDNDFLKVRNIGLSYNFGKIIPAVENIRFGLNFRNPFNFTGGPYDPETTGSGIAAQNGFSSGGFFYGTESPPKSIIASLKFDF